MPFSHYPKEEQKSVKQPLLVSPRPAHTNTQGSKAEPKYLWSKFPNPLCYWLIDHFYFADIFLSGDGKVEVFFWQEDRLSLHHFHPKIHTNKGGAHNS